MGGRYSGSISGCDRMDLKPGPETGFRYQGSGICGLNLKLGGGRRVAGGTDRARVQQGARAGVCIASGASAARVCWMFRGQRRVLEGQARNRDRQRGAADGQRAQCIGCPGPRSCIVVNACPHVQLSSMFMRQT